MIDDYIKILNFQCHIFLVLLYGMANVSFRQILSYIGSIHYIFTNKLLIVDIYNYHVLFLFSEIYIHNRINYLLFYSFIYNQQPR